MARRTLAAAIAATALATVAGPLTPASAHEAVCAGTGSVTLSAGLYYVGIGTSVTANITAFTFTGTCNLTATGTIVGHCGNSSGEVDVNDGTNTHKGYYKSAGSVLLFGTAANDDPPNHGPGDVTGVVDAVPAPGESCVPGGAGAKIFTVAGTVRLT